MNKIKAQIKKGFCVKRRWNLLRRFVKEFVGMNPEKETYRCVSYSQLGEDRMIYSYLKGINAETISYIDIGANHPYYLSNTALLDETFRIKKGVLVEPSYELYCKLKKERKVICENIGVYGTRNMEEELTFYIMDADVLSSFDEEEVKKNEERGYKLIATRKVSVMYINDLLEKHFRNDKIDVVSIDVEGMDNEIARAFDYEKYQPRIICIETSHIDRESLNCFMESKGYLIYGVTCENTIYIRR